MSKLENIIESEFAPMAVVATPDDTLTVHPWQESYGPEEYDQMRKLPSPHNSKSEKAARLKEYVRGVVDNYLNTLEGQEFKRYLQKNSNGKGVPSKIEEVIVRDMGKGVLGATLPGYDKPNLVLNRDYSLDNISAIANRNGLTTEQGVEEMVKHEMRHYFVQDLSRMNNLTPEQRAKVELENDVNLIAFNIGMIKKDPYREETYLRKALFHIDRYKGTKLEKPLREMFGLLYERATAKKA